MPDYETVQTSAEPMLFISRRTGMGPADVSRVMQECFARIGNHIERKAISPAGPPVCIYHDWDGQEMTVDVGFPVREEDLFKQDGELKAGHTPARKALRALHKGPYTGLRKTYSEMERHLRDDNQRPPDLSWEVYLNDPALTAPDDLETEVYMTLS